ncbi:MAG: DUF262 domain-containing protein [Micrococcales bacterium]|nr:DUF262 domain-containing protein [Micrococcales bacterium]
MTTIFKPVRWEVQKLVDGVEQGTISLPDLQRPFVWQATKVRDLFDSIYRGHPVGEIMFWDVSAEGSTKSIGLDGKLAAKHQIVDGQQRLTSLFAAIKGAEITDSNYRSRRMRIAFNPGTERFEVWSPFIQKNPQWIPDIAGYFAEPWASTEAYKERLAESVGRGLTNEDHQTLADIFQKLHGVLGYQFEVIHIQEDVEKKRVADIFVRINSEGVNLKAYDYILTWLSVFWPEGRETIEGFARDSRVTPERASERTGSRVGWTPWNCYINVEPGHVVRAMVAMGQNRARLVDAYAALQAKDRSTGEVDGGRQERELAKLKQALPWVTNHTNWTEFIHTVRMAGFRSRQGITSNTNLVSSYVVFLLGRIKYAVDLPVLRVLIARWLFMSQLTSRYTGSSESMLQQELDRFGRVEAGDAAGFVGAAERVIETTLTEDFWRVSVPEALVTSGPALSPIYQCYLAALNTLDAEMFLLASPRVRTWMDPSSPQQRGMEGHHLFPRNHLETVLGITDLKWINQAANFAPTDWDTNVEISNRPPAEYWPELVDKRGFSGENLERQMYWHALPEGWHETGYDEFLIQRRALMSRVIRDGFDSIGQSAPAAPSKLRGIDSDAAGAAALQDLLEKGLLRANDLLDPVDPNWIVDAVVSDDGNVVIDGIRAFDSLDDAATYLGVTSIDGLDFWALECPTGLKPLREILTTGRP